MHTMMKMRKLDSSWIKGVALFVGACGLMGCVTPEPPAPPPEEPQEAVDLRSLITIPSETEAEDPGASLRSKIFIPSEN